jgi:hypothetical protein
MNKLNLEHINRSAPYFVREREDRNCEFYFWSDYGIEYSINFTPNHSVIPSGAYELGINNRGHKASPSDHRFLRTLIVIIEEFFNSNNDVMIYLAETGDGKQAFRNRLFIRWFNTYEHKDSYYLKTAEGKMEGIDNFMALISKIDNPRLSDVIEEFDETVELLFDKPDTNILPL